MTASEIDLTDLDYFEDGVDHHAFRRLRDDDPLHWNDEPDGRGFWSVTRYDDIKQVAGDHGTFSSAQGTQIPDRRAEGTGDPSIHNMDPPEHSALRRLAVPLTRPAAVRKLDDEVTRAVNRLLDDIGTREVDLVAEFSARLPLLVIGGLLGAPPEDADRLLTWTNQMASEDPEYSEGPETAARARDEVFAYFRSLEEERRLEPRKDLISTLVHAEVDGRPLTGGQLGAYYLVMMVAGNETTRNLITGTVLAFHEFPGHWRMLRESADAIDSMVEESARWVSPIICMRRTATRDVEMHGHQVREGQKVVMWFSSANRDERVFEDPDTYDGARFRSRRADHLGYGWGVHACIGAHLARLEGRVVLRTLRERGQRFEVTGAPARLRSNFFRGYKRLPVRLVGNDE